jgi:Na+/H+ antiporter NhaD/arsenite permease-like protein
MDSASVFTSLAAVGQPGVGTPAIFGVPVEFALFAITLLGIALFFRHSLNIALVGLVAITLWKLRFGGFPEGPGLPGLAGHLATEWVKLANLFGLLLGFALLERHFDKSRVPLLLPRYLPNDWKGAFTLLVIVFVLSAFLDNIAAALIGGALAQSLFRHRVHIGYVAAIVAAANAGGVGSVVGDTTTTMMWIGGVDPLHVLSAYLGGVVALVICGIPASCQQQKYSPILANGHEGTKPDWTRIGIVVTMLAAAIGTNVLTNTASGHRAALFPFIGAAIWIPLLWAVPMRRPDWECLPAAFRGTVFLLALVLSASMMPVEHLPAPSWQSALGLGSISAAFDNIPLTALALKQGGYDWGVLAYAVGFGGSMLWFGSSAGVALSNMYPEARSTRRWIQHGWPVVVAYVAGFTVLIWIHGWHPDLPTRQIEAPIEHPQRVAPVSGSGARRPLMRVFGGSRADLPTD